MIMAFITFCKYLNISKNIITISQALKGERVIDGAL